jgi:CDP-diacylglycerol--glycerol-3-phosphate 3-phosphatidyltransferase
MLERLKPAYNCLLSPIAHICSKLGLRPNHLSLTGLVLFSLAGWFVYRGRWIPAAAAIVLGSACDGLDGLLARLDNKKTAFGAVLDSACDRLTEIVLLLGLLGFYLTRSPAPMLAPGIVLCYTAVTLSLMVSYVKARAEGMGIACTTGLLQRPERIILIGAGLLAGPAAMVWILGALSALAGITVVQRMMQAYWNAENIPPASKK